MRKSYLSTLIAAGLLTLTLPALANELDVPIIERGDYDDVPDAEVQEILPTCLISAVAGLSADGFLAVRSGPGAQYRKLAELHNGDIVYVFERKGEWRGIAYDTDRSFQCLSPKTRPVTYRNKGWVHGKWIKDLDIG